MMISQTANVAHIMAQPKNMAKHFFLPFTMKVASADRENRQLHHDIIFSSNIFVNPEKKIFENFQILNFGFLLK
jgi:hypothetical protein